MIRNWRVKLHKTADVSEDHCPQKFIQNPKEFLKTLYGDSEDGIILEVVQTAATLTTARPLAQNYQVGHCNRSQLQKQLPPHHCQGMLRKVLEILYLCLCLQYRRFAYPYRHGHGFLHKNILAKAAQCIHIS